LIHLPTLKTEKGSAYTDELRETTEEREKGSRYTFPRSKLKKESANTDNLRETTEVREEGS